MGKMTVVRYTQEHDKDVWLPHSEVVEQDHIPLYSNKPGSRHTILSVDYDFLAKNVGRPKQAGWLWVDIDHADLSVALASAVKLVKRLKRDYKLKDEFIHVSLSGSKGVHIYLSPNLMYDGGLRHNLSYTYGAMVSRWKVVGADTQIYIEGRGRPVRADNTRRPDGKYKVQITVDELCNKVTPLNYATYVSKPRDIIPDPKPELNEGLARLFNECFENVEANNVIQQEVVDDNVADSKGIDGTPIIPPCITLMTSGRVTEESTFDAAKLQLALYLNSSSLSAASKEALRVNLATNLPSSKGASVSRRIGIITNQEKRIDKRRVTDTFCHSMKSLLSENPSCQSCGLREQLQNLNAEIAMDEPEQVIDWMSSSRVAERSGGYYTKGAEPRRLTSFLISRLTSVLSGDDDEGRASYHCVEITVPEFGKKYVIDLFPVEAWLSKSAFKAAVAGYTGVIFYGNDADVANIVHHLDMKEQALRGGLPAITLCDIAGINVTPVERKDTFDVFWVEPRYSLDDYMIVNSYKYVGGEQIVPTLRGYNPDKDVSADAWDALIGLTKINTQYNMAILIGFMFYSLISQQLGAKKLIVGSLSVAGEKGSGKSKAIQACMCLSGLNFNDAGKTLSPAGTTQLPYVKAMAGRGGYPVVLNEMNVKSMSHERMQYIMELVKSLYDMGVVSKGAIKSNGVRGLDNTKVVNHVLRAPVIMLSEEPITGDTVRAVLDRLIPLDFDKRELMQRRDVFHSYADNFPNLTEIGRALMFRSIITKVEEVMGCWDEAELPEALRKSDVGDRRKTVYQMICTGYVWALPQLVEIGAPDDVILEIQNLYKHLLTLMNDAAWVETADTTASELHSFFDRLAVLAKIGSNPETSKDGVAYGTHFVVEDTRLILDAKLCHIAYVAHLRKLNQVTPYRYDNALISAIKNSNYYIDEGYHGKNTVFHSAKTLVVDLTALAKDGIETHNFNLAF